MNDDKTIVSIEEQIERAKADVKKKYGSGAMAGAAGGGVVFGAAAVAIPLSVFPRKDEVPQIDEAVAVVAEEEQSQAADVIVAEEAEATDAVDVQADDTGSVDVQAEEISDENVIDIADVNVGNGGFVGATRIAHNVSDDMSFGEAFAHARAEVGPGGIFEWRGNTYGTYYVDEWNSMTPADKDEYWAAVYQAVGIDNGSQGYGYENYAGNSNDIQVIDSQDVDGDGKDDAWLVDVNDDGQGDAVILDVDGDGQGDIVVFDANGNEAPDFIVDLNNDGNMELILDAEIGEDGKFIYDEANVYQIDSIDNNAAQGNPNVEFVDDIDFGAQVVTDPNIPIENNIDMDGMS